MAESLTHNETLLDPKSLILSQFSDSHQLHLIKNMERGPRYKEYSDLRNKRLRTKLCPEKEKPYNNPSVLTPPMKQVKFNPNLLTRPKGSSILTQSVPDFSSALRKENRKPSMGLPPVAERSATPPSGLLKSRKVYGSKSTNSAEKRSGGLMARKSYASVEELKGLAAVGNGINGENRGGGRKSVLGYRQF